MTSGTTLVSSSLLEGTFTTTTPWLIGSSSASIPTVDPPVPSNSDRAGESSAPLSGEMGSSASLLSSTMTNRGGTTRVTTAMGSAVTTGIATITAAVVLKTGREEATPIKGGRATTSLLPLMLAATRYRLGLHSSRTGGGEITRLASAWPLQKKAQKQVSHA